MSKELVHGIGRTAVGLAVTAFSIYSAYLAIKMLASPEAAQAAEEATKVGFEYFYNMGLFFFGFSIGLKNTVKGIDAIKDELYF